LHPPRQTKRRQQRRGDAKAGIVEATQQADKALLPVALSDGTLYTASRLVRWQP
jgi:hypothetical protein